MNTKTDQISSGLVAHIAAFKEALNGTKGDLDAWLECNDESEVRQAIFGVISEAEAIVAAKDAERFREGWTHACNALCMDDVELWIPQCPHCGKPAPTPPVSEDRKDAELLDYIQNHGATIQIVPMANRTFGFEVGGLHKSRKLSVREAIDAAMQEDKKP